MGCRRSWFSCPSCPQETPVSDFRATAHYRCPLTTHNALPNEHRLLKSTMSHFCPVFVCQPLTPRFRLHGPPNSAHADPFRVLLAPDQSVAYEVEFIPPAEDRESGAGLENFRDILCFHMPCGTLEVPLSAVKLGGGGSVAAVDFAPDAAVRARARRAAALSELRAGQPPLFATYAPWRPVVSSHQGPSLASLAVPRCCARFYRAARTTAYSK